MSLDRQDKSGEEREKAKDIGKGSIPERNDPKEDTSEKDDPKDNGNEKALQGKSTDSNNSDDDANETPPDDAVDSDDESLYEDDPDLNTYRPEFENNQDQSKEERTEEQGPSASKAVNAPSADAGETSSASPNNTVEEDHGSLSPPQNTAERWEARNMRESSVESDISNNSSNAGVHGVRIPSDTSLGYGGRTNEATTPTQGYYDDDDLFGDYEGDDEVDDEYEAHSDGEDEEGQDDRDDFASDLWPAATEDRGEHIPIPMLMMTDPLGEKSQVEHDEPDESDNSSSAFSDDSDGDGGEERYERSRCPSPEDRRVDDEEERDEHPPRPSSQMGFRDREEAIAAGRDDSDEDDDDERNELPPRPSSRASLRSRDEAWAEGLDDDSDEDEEGSARRTRTRTYEAVVDEDEGEDGETQRYPTRSGSATPDSEVEHDSDDTQSQSSDTLREPWMHVHRPRTPNGTVIRSQRELLIERLENPKGRTSRYERSRSSLSISLGIDEVGEYEGKEQGRAQPTEWRSPVSPVQGEASGGRTSPVSPPDEDKIDQDLFSGFGGHHGDNGKPHNLDATSDDYSSEHGAIRVADVPTIHQPRPRSQDLYVSEGGFERKHSDENAKADESVMGKEDPNERFRVRTENIRPLSENGESTEDWKSRIIEELDRKSRINEELEQQLVEQYDGHMKEKSELNAKLGKALTRNPTTHKAVQTYEVPTSKSRIDTDRSTETPPEPTVLREDPDDGASSTISMHTPIELSPEPTVLATQTNDGIASAAKIDDVDENMRESTGTAGQDNGKNPARRLDSDQGTEPPEVIVSAEQTDGETKTHRPGTDQDQEDPSEAEEVVFTGRGRPHHPTTTPDMGAEQEAEQLRRENEELRKQLADLQPQVRQTGISNTVASKLAITKELMDKALKKIDQLQTLLLARDIEIVSLKRAFGLEPKATTVILSKIDIRWGARTAPFDERRIRRENLINECKSLINEIWEETLPGIERDVEAFEKDLEGVKASSAEIQKRWQADPVVQRAREARGSRRRAASPQP